MPIYLLVDKGRKSSEDLIRQARNRNSRDWNEPESAPDPPAEPPEESLENPVETDTTPSRVPDQQSPTNTVDEQVEPAPTQPRRSGSFFRSVGVRLVLAALFAGGWWLFTSFDDASRDGGGEIVGGGDLDVMTMQTGDCFNDPDELEGVVYDVAAVPCTEPHDNEVFAVHSVGSSFGDEFPGQSALEQHSFETCVGSFAGYVGVDYAVSSLGVFTFTPTAESWNEGDREFVCALYSLDFAKLEGSARGSGL